METIRKLFVFFRSRSLCFTFAVGATFSVMTYFHDNNENLMERRHDVEIAECEANFGAIERLLVSGYSLELKKLFIESSADSVPPGAVLFDEGFYALKDFPNFTYSYSNAGEALEEYLSPLLIQLTNGEEQEVAEIHEMFALLTRDRPGNMAHRWNGDKTYNVSMTILENDIQLELRPWISVSYVNFEDIRRIVDDWERQYQQRCSTAHQGGLMDCDIGPTVKMMTSKSFVKNAALLGASEIWKLMLWFNNVSDIKLNYEIEEMSKEEDYAYIRYRLGAKDIEVNRKVRQEAFIQLESLIAFTPDGFVTINVSIPYISHADKAIFSRRVNRWLSGLRILTD